MFHMNIVTVQAPRLVDDFADEKGLVAGAGNRIHSSTESA
jgi:hypothetical protein